MIEGQSIQNVYFVNSDGSKFSVDIADLPDGDKFDYLTVRIAIRGMNSAEFAFAAAAVLALDEAGKVAKVEKFATEELFNMDRLESPNSHPFCWAVVK